MTNKTNNRINKQKAQFHVSLQLPRTPYGYLH